MDKLVFLLLFKDPCHDALKRFVVENRVSSQLKKILKIDAFVV